MLNIEELPTTALVTIMHEISNTNMFMDMIDDKLATGNIQPHEAEYYIHLLNEQETYYKALEQEIHNRWGFYPSDEIKKVK